MLPGSQKKDCKYRWMWRSHKKNVKKKKRHCSFYKLQEVIWAYGVQYYAQWSSWCLCCESIAWRSWILMLLFFFLHSREQTLDVFFAQWQNINGRVPVFPFRSSLGWSPVNYFFCTVHFIFLYVRCWYLDVCACRLWRGAAVASTLHVNERSVQ